MTIKRILIVDDEEDLRIFLEDFFIDRDFDVQSVGSGEEAIAKMEEKPFDIIFLDVMMPGMDGLECLQILKEKFPKTTIVMITALKDQVRIEKAQKLGASNYIVKPFSLNYLEKELTKLLGEG